MLVMVCQALGELAIVYPETGGFYEHFSRFIDPSYGAALGLNYAWGCASSSNLARCDS